MIKHWGAFSVWCVLSAFLFCSFYSTFSSLQNEIEKHNNMDQMSILEKHSGSSSSGGMTSYKFSQKKKLGLFSYSLTLCNCNYSCSSSSVEDMFQDIPWMPETSNSTGPYIEYTFNKM
jgi:hypothetical protein